MTDGAKTREIDRFIDQFWQDWDLGNVRELEDYLEMFPGAEHEIQVEFVSLNNSLGVSGDDSDRIGFYRIVRLLGSGGQANVYLAEDSRNGMRVALKVLPSGPADFIAIERFKREARLAARLQHPSICPILDARFSGREFYIAMAYVEGRSLLELINATWKTASRKTDESFFMSLSGSSHAEDTAAEEVTEAGTQLTEAAIRRFVRIIVEAADAVHVAHETGIIHRDIKPANIIVEAESNRAVLVDFGLARSETSDVNRTLTRPGDFMGTPAFMSPEQLLAGRITLDHRTDVYSLAASLYQALTGILPFQESNSEKLYQSILSQAPTAPSRVRSRVPETLDAVILKALSKDRDERQATAEELARELEEAIEGLEEESRLNVSSTDASLTNRAPARDSQDETRIVPVGTDSSDTLTRVSRPSESGKSRSAAAEDIKLLHEIGRGGGGVVYEAYQESLNRQVAVKFVLHPEGLDETAKDKLLAEAGLAARLQHPNIVTVYSAGVRNEQPYYVMELVRGRPLSEILAALRDVVHDGDTAEFDALPPATRDLLIPDLEPWCRSSSRGDSGDSSVSWKQRTRLRRMMTALWVDKMIRVIEALEYALLHNTVHGDIKPSNLLFDHGGRLRIVDFGLARRTEDDDVTMQGAGSLRYMSPERLNEQDGPTPSSDVYSVGATLYEALTLETAHAGDDPVAVAAAIVSGSITPPRQLNASIHPDLEYIVMRCLAARPSRRYRDVGAVLLDLQRFMSRLPVRRGGSRFVGCLGKHGWLKASALAVLVLAILAWAGRFLAGEDHETEIREFRRVMAEAEDNALQALTGLIDGGEPGECLRRMRNAIDRPTDAIARQYSTVPADVAASMVRSFRRRVGQIRVIGLNAGGLQEEAAETLVALRQNGLLEEGFDADLSALGSLDRVVLTGPDGPALEAALERLDSDGTFDPEPCFSRRSRYPIEFDSLIKGVYRISLRDAEGRTISFPIRVNESIRVTVPLRPSDVPDRMEWIATHDDRFTIGDAVTQWPDGSVGPRERQLNESLLLQKYEVTHREFGEFIAEPSYRRRLLHAIELYMDLDEEDAESLCDEHLLPSTWRDGQPPENMMENPVTGIGFHHALAYCDWRKVMLPTTDAWERAGRGLIGRRYPYGNARDPDRIERKTLGNVGSVPGDVSIYRVHDLCGSARELVLTPDRGGFLVRGGQFEKVRPLARGHRIRLSPGGERVLSGRRLTSYPTGFAEDGVGFRCARPARDLVVERLTP